MGQQQYGNDDKRASDAIGSPHNLNDQKSRNHAKFGGRQDVNPLLKGGGSKARAGATWPVDKEKPR